MHGVRRHAPGPRLFDRRRYPAYSTEVCVLLTGLEEAAAIPLAAALRMILPCALRGASELVRTRHARFARAVLATLGARVSQTLQYGVLLLAVGGSLGLDTALATQGMQLVGAAAGGLVPGQVGVIEGAYRLFADALSLDAPRALSIGLVSRVSAILLAAAALLALAVTRDPTE